MVYLCTLVALLLCSWLYDCRRTLPLRNACFRVLCAVLTLIAALRFRVGMDSIAYESIYQSLPSLGTLSLSDFAESRFEPAWLLLCALLRSISPEFLLLQMVHAIFVNWAVGRFIQRSSRHPFIALTLYFLILFIPFSTEILRQSVAISIFLLAWPLLRARHFVVFSLLILIASAFHVSALPLLLLPALALPGLRRLFLPGPWAAVPLALSLAAGLLFFHFFPEILDSLALYSRRAYAYARQPQSLALLNWKGIIFAFLKSALFPLAALWVIRYRRSSSASGRFGFSVWSLSLLYCCAALFALPCVAAMRMALYLLPFAFVTVADAALCDGLRQRLHIARTPAAALLTIPWMLLCLCSYAIPVGSGTPFRTYMAYYPYIHILNPQELPQREAMATFCMDSGDN